MVADGCFRNYSINQHTLFDENYALASTQALKNKDIPEDGVMGTILPSLGANPCLCFKKCVNVCLHLSYTVMDVLTMSSRLWINLLIPGQIPGIKEHLVDLYKKPEILFFGPDEGDLGSMVRGINPSWWGAS